jgi:hypothetical protein
MERSAPHYLVRRRHALCVMSALIFVGSSLTAIAGCFDIDALSASDSGDSGENQKKDASGGGGNTSIAAPRDSGKGDAAARGSEMDSLRGSDAASCDFGFPKWIPWTDVSMPHPDSVYVGKEEKGGSDGGYYSFYVCRAPIGSTVFPGKFISTIGCFYTPDGIIESMADTFELLLDSPTRPCVSWAKSIGSTVSPDAIIAGNADAGSLYACRGFYGGQTSLGTHAGYVSKAIPTNCLISFRGNAQSLTVFDVLVAPPY